DSTGVKCSLPAIPAPPPAGARAKLGGTPAFPGPPRDRRGRYTHAGRYEVATADMIRQLPPKFALVIRGAAAPVIARLPAAWHDPVYRRARRRGQHIAVLAPAAAARAAQDPRPGGRPADGTGTAAPRSPPPTTPRQARP